MLRLTAPGLDPLDLSDWGEGFVHTQLQVGGPVERAASFDRPAADGDDDYTLLVGARVVTVGLDLLYQPHTFRALLDRMGPYLNVAKRITLEFAEDGVPPRSLTVRSSPMDVTYDNASHLRPSWPFKTVGSPWWRGEDRTISLVPMPPPPGRVYDRDGALRSYPDPPEGQMISAFNGGSVDADWVWTIHGPVTGPALRNETTGDQVRLPGLTLVEGQKAVVDSSTRQVTVDGQARFSTVDFASSTWWRVPAGQTVTVSMPVARYSDPAVGVLAFTDLHHS